MRKIKYLKLLTIIFIVLLPASGCWDAKDINDQEIVTAALIDRTDTGYVYYVEIASISGSASGDESAKGVKKPIIVKAEGKDFVEARENLDRELNKPVFLGASHAVIVTDRMAAADIEGYLLRLRELHDYRKTIDIVVIHGDPEDFMSINPANQQSVGFAIDSTITGLTSAGEWFHFTLADVMAILSSPYKHYVLCTFANRNGEVTLIGFTVFSGGVKTGFIPAEDCKSIVLMNSRSPHIWLNIPYKDMQVAVDVRLIKKRITPYYTNDKPSFDVDLSLKATLLYPEKEKRITDEAKEEIKKSVQSELQKELEDTFSKSQTEYQYDCFGLHDYFRIYFPDEYKKMNWAEEYETVAAHFTTSLDLEISDLIDYNPPLKK